MQHGEITLNKPVIYQISADGGRSEVKGAYAIEGNIVGFKLERYDSNKTLIIDPVLSYSTLLGSSSDDTVAGIAVDSQGSAYVTGTTDSISFPTTSGAFKSTSTRGGAFVTKLDPTGSSLVYSTYLNSNGTNTSGLGIAVDSAGNAHVTGTVSQGSATDFPIVNGLKTNSGFFKSVDAAASWSNMNTGIDGSVKAIAVVPSAPNTIYATADKFYRSTDGGTTWTNAAGTNLPSPNFTNTMVVDPADGAVVYIGHFSGLYKTTNGGNNWSSVIPTPQSFGSVFSIVFDPATPSTMYVAANTGVYKSTDSGSTWSAPNNLGITGAPNVHALAVDPSAPSTIYAGTFGNGLFKSTNGGGTWTAMNSGMGTSAPTFVSTIVIDPANPSTLYTGNGSVPGGGGINKSTNGAASWTPLTTDVPNAAVTAMVATSSAIYAYSNSILKSTNGGTS